MSSQGVKSGKSGDKSKLREPRQSIATLRYFIESNQDVPGYSYMYIQIANMAGLYGWSKLPEHLLLEDDGVQ